MAKKVSAKKVSAKKASPKKAALQQAAPKKAALKKGALKKGALKKALPKRVRKTAAVWPLLASPEPGAPDAAVLDRLWGVVASRRDADPAISHSARLLARGTAKVAQKLGEEAVECVIEAVAGNRPALIAESADVLYHLIVVWVNAGVRADEVWAELQRREGVSGVAEKASRSVKLAIAQSVRTRKIP